MKVCFILGTRPEIIKLSSLIHICIDKKTEFFIIHTNQHYSENMDEVFFRELNLPSPDYNLGISGEATHGAMIGKMIEGIESILIKEKPTVVVVQGDTNSVLAGSLSASKIQIPIAHVESGLRSYDRSMPEEANRVVTDHISSFLFVPTQKQLSILTSEGISRKQIFVTGNTIADAVLECSKGTLQTDTNLYSHKYILLTLHRPSNVDDDIILKSHISNLEIVATSLNLPILFPLHPRTRKRLEAHNIKLNKSIFKELTPVGFLKMIQLEKYASLIITDSGGIQEEACILKVPCLTLRENTERPETVQVGGNLIVGNSKERLLSGAKKMINSQRKWKSPYGRGNAGKKIYSILTRAFENI